MRRSLILSVFIFIALQAMSQTVDFNYSTANGLYCNPQPVTFTQNCTPAPSGFIWNFGNGKTSSNPVEVTTYSNPGTYTVKLTAIYANTAITVAKNIVINPKPIVSLSADKNYLCQPGPVVLTATGSAFISNYEWDFGDGSPLQQTANNGIAHNYSGYNNYTAKVKVTTAKGCTNASDQNIQIKKFPVTGTVTPSSGCVPSNSVLTVTTDLPPGEATQNFTWDFGDGTPVVNNNSASVNHIYNITTTITTANVSVTTTGGCSNQFSFAPFAYGTPPFGTDARTATGQSRFCGSETIRLNGKATNATSYTWDFGDGTSASVTDTFVTHKFRALGNMRVILTPYFHGCPGAKDTVDVFIEGVIADYSLNNTCTNKNTFSFINLSLGNVDHFEWVFSDIPTIIDSTNYNPTHMFPQTGVFNASLLLIDSITGCRDSLTRPVLTAQPVVTRSSQTVCKDSLIRYQVLNTYPPGYGYTYEYHINGVVLDNGTITDRVWNPINRGDFTEYVVIRDTLTGTCNDTLYLTGQTRVRGPIADFDAPLRVCADTALSVTDTSYPFFSGDNIIKWEWNFDDNTTDTAQNPPPHSFPSIGMFTVVLKVTDINGCENLAGQLIHIAHLPSVSVFPRVDTLCQGSYAVLTAFTTDSINWSPSANINCIDCDTVQVNPVITTSYIATAINAFGCKSRDTALVKVFAPIDLVVYPADTSICPGETIRYNTNVDGDILWSPATFLNKDTIRNPIAKPDSAITYRVTLSDSVGCFTDTAFAVVRTYPVPTVDAGADKILSYNAPFTITPVYSSDVTSYSWTPDINLSCNNCANPTGTALQKTTYRIEVANINGCRNYDSITVFVNCLQANLLMPTAFTPNNDGKNDYFYPITRGYKMVKSFIIYNRLGYKVFERTNFLPNTPSLGWNGKVNGSGNPNTEVFTWYMEAECDLGRMNNSMGTVVLIR